MDDILAIRNELANDGLIYINYIRPIFSESVTEAILFFKSWRENASTIEQFQEELTPMTKKIRLLMKNLEANSLIHE